MSTTTGGSTLGRMPSVESGVQGSLDPCGGGGVTNPGPQAYTFVNFYHHRDHLGSLRVATDSAGWLSTATDLYAYGFEMGSTGSDSGQAVASRRRFTGHERDASGLDYMKARYRNPASTGFLAADPATESTDAALPQTWNRSSYVLDSPIIHTDPSGRIWVLFSRKGSHLGTAFIASLNKQFKGVASFSIDKSNQVHVQVSRGGLKAATSGQKAFVTFAKALSESKSVTVQSTLVSGSDSVAHDRYNTNEIDVADNNALGDGPGVSALGALAHGLYEQYQHAAHRSATAPGTLFESDHIVANSFQGLVDGATKLESLRSGPFLSSRDGTGDLNMPFLLNNGTTVTVTQTFSSNNVVNVTRH